MLDLGIHQLPHLLVGTVVTLAAFSDLKTRRIPNRLTFPALAAALCLSVAVSGLDGPGGLLDSLAGLGLCLGLMLIPYLCSMMGGGDVKLMAVVGASLGLEGGLTALLLVSVSGGVLALASMTSTYFAGHGLSASLVNAGLALAAPGGVRSTLLAANKSQARPLPYGLAIALGTLLAMGWRHAGHPWLITF